MMRKTNQVRGFRICSSGLFSVTVEAGLSNRARKKQSRKPWTPPRVKTLTEDDLDKYTIFDVIMPLPGTDVAYPGDALGAKYRQFLEMDGLDPDNWVRKQKYALCTCLIPISCTQHWTEITRLLDHIARFFICQVK